MDECFGLRLLTRRRMSGLGLWDCELDGVNGWDECEGGCDSSGDGDRDGCGIEACMAKDA